MSVTLLAEPLEAERITDGHGALPLVSVGVFAHNQGEFVRECLDSVIASDYPELQLVIVDDGSRDHTDAEIRRWLRAHPAIEAVHLRHPAAEGIGRSLNDAIGLCRGEFLTGLAADDVLLPGGIAARVGYLRAHPRKLAVFADAHVISEDGTLLFESAIEGHYRRFGMRKRDLTVDEFLPLSLVFNWAIPGPVFMCRRRAYDVVGMYDETLTTEDFDMYLRLAARGSLGFHDGYVGSYRIHDGSMTRRAHDRMLADAATTARVRAVDFDGASALRLRAQADLWEAGQSSSRLRRSGLRLRGWSRCAAATAIYRVTRWWIGAGGRGGTARQLQGNVECPRLR